MIQQLKLNFLMIMTCYRIGKDYKQSKGSFWGIIEGNVGRSLANYLTISMLTSLYATGTGLTFLGLQLPMW